MSRGHLYFLGGIFLSGNCLIGNYLLGHCPRENCSAPKFYDLKLHVAFCYAMILGLEFTKMAFLKFEHV